MREYMARLVESLEEGESLMLSRTGTFDLVVEVRKTTAGETVTRHDVLLIDDIAHEFDRVLEHWRTLLGRVRGSRGYAGCR